MNRRAFLIAAGGISTGVGAMFLSGSAAAADVETGVFGVTDTVEIDSNTGRLSRFELTDVSVVAEWSGFDSAAAHVEWVLTATHDGTEKTIGEAAQDIDGGQYEGSVTADLGTLDLLQPFGAETFAVEAADDPTEPTTEDFDLTFALTATVTDADGVAVDETVTGSSTASITNLPMDVGVGGDGELVGDGEAESPEFDPMNVDGEVLATIPEEPAMFQITNRNPAPALVRLTTDGLHDGGTFTVGARQYGKRGKTIEFEEPTTVRNLEAKRVGSDGEFEPTAFDGPTGVAEDE